jgi:hypothetical protein
MTAPDVGLGDNVAGADQEIDTIIESAFDEQYGPADAPSDSDETPADDAAQSDDDTEAQQTRQDRGDGRDEAGRFTAKTDPEAQADDQPPEGEDGATETEAQTGKETDEATGEAEGEPLPEFSFTSDGQEFSFEGSEEGEDGVYFPTESVSNLKQLLAAGRTHLTTFRDRLAEKDGEVQRVTDEGKQYLEAVNAKYTRVLGKFQELVTLYKTDPDKVLDFFEQAQTQMPVLQAQAEAAESKRLIDLQKSQYERLQEAETLRTETPKMRDRLATAIVYYGRQADLPRETQVALFRRLARPEQLNQLFPKGQDGRRNIESAALEQVRSEVEFLSQVAPKGQARKKSAKAVNEAAKTAVKGTKRPAKPSVQTKGKGTKAPGTKPRVKMPKTREEADAFLGQGKYNDMFE